MITSSGFTLPVDIGNRALHHVGADHELTTIADQSKPARLVRSVYTKLRQAELRRNAWTFAIRYAVLRPIDTTSVEWTPPTYSAAATYTVGKVVQYDDGLGSRLYIANTTIAAGITPLTTSWSDYFGALIAPLWVTGTTYYSGEIVYKGAFTVYLALAQSAEDPATSSDWVSVGTVAKIVSILYPLTSGPVNQTGTRNAYPVPYGYLRKLKADPSAGIASYLGAPSNANASDWTVENGYIVTQDTGPIVLRFVADAHDVTKFDAMFGEGLAAKIGFELAEPLTQSTEKVKMISGVYQKAITEARLVNSIENGADAPELDDWLACRV